MQQSPKSQKSSPHENITMFLLPEFQSQTMPITPMPRQPHELPNPIRDSQPSKSNTPPNKTSATDRGKIAHFATKFKEKYERNDPNSSLRRLDRKGYKDYNNLIKTIYNLYIFILRLFPCAPEFCQMIYDVLIVKRIFPSLDDLALVDVVQYVVTLLDGLEFMPQDISKRATKLANH